MDNLDTPQTLELVDPSDAILNQRAKEVAMDQINSPFVQGLIDRMLQLSAGKSHSKHDSRQMVGLAAVQLGVGSRVVTIDITADGSVRDQNLEVFINPVLSNQSTNLVDGREGCWSCGTICGNVQRSKSVTLTALNRSGEPVVVELTDFVARIAQHEVDHLDGIRFPDRIPIDEPHRLHTVLPSEFPAYRKEWQDWPHLCSRDVWNDMKAGVATE